MSVNPDTGLEDDPGSAWWQADYDAMLKAEQAKWASQLGPQGGPQPTTPLAPGQSWVQDPGGPYGTQWGINPGGGTPAAGTAPAGPGSANPASGGPSGSIGSLLGGGGFQAPSQVNLGGPAGIPYIPPTPVFTPPGLPKPPGPFSYDPFKAPTGEEALNDPGYQFRRNQGEDALQRWAAARGTLNDSGTAKALQDYGQNAASQEYQNVWQRMFGQWQAGLNAALSTYNTNYGTQVVDPYKNAYQQAQDVFSPQMTGYQTQAQAGQRANELNYSNAWDLFLDQEKQKQNDFDNRFRLATA